MVGGCKLVLKVDLSNRGVNSSFSFHEFVSFFSGRDYIQQFFLVTCILTTPPKGILRNTWGGEAVRILVH